MWCFVLFFEDCDPSKAEIRTEKQKKPIQRYIIEASSRLAASVWGATGIYHKTDWNLPKRNTHLGKERGKRLSTGSYPPHFWVLQGRIQKCIPRKWELSSLHPKARLCKASQSLHGRGCSALAEVSRARRILEWCTVPTLPPYVASAQSIFDLFSRDLATLTMFKDDLSITSGYAPYLEEVYSCSHLVPLGQLLKHPPPLHSFSLSSFCTGLGQPLEVFWG